LDISNFWTFGFSIKSKSSKDFGRKQQILPKPQGFHLSKFWILLDLGQDMDPFVFRPKSNLDLGELGEVGELALPP
jgi:hypothetical protein